MLTTSHIARRRRGELLALFVVLLVGLGLPASIFAYQRLYLPRTYGQVKVFDLMAQMPEGGGWQPERIRVNVGDRVRLRLHGRDVVHGFAIGRLGVDHVLVYPGQVATVEFVAHRPGRFTYYCNVWCSPSHWRMRGVLEVIDPTKPDNLPVEERTPDQVTFESLGLDVDAPHPAAHYPLTRPSAVRGRALAPRLGDELKPWTDRKRLRMTSPSEVFAGLQSGPASDLSPDEVWDLVAFLWSQTTTPEDLSAGKELYNRNCAACHGVTGAGDGPGGRYLQATALSEDGGHAEHDAGQRQPAAFAKAQTMAGGSGWLYYGKMARGGMGTGMPYWGPIFTDQEMWQIIDYLWTFLFDYEG